MRQKGWKSRGVEPSRRRRWTSGLLGESHDLLREWVALGLEMGQVDGEVFEELFEVQPLTRIKG